MLGEKRRVTLREPPGLPSHLPPPKGGGKLQPIPNPQPCQTDWDCPELWPSKAGRCGVVPGTLARPSVATAKGLSLGKEEGGRAGPGVGEGGWQNLSRNLAEQLGELGEVLPWTGGLGGR